MIEVLFGISGVYYFVDVYYWYLGEGVRVYCVVFFDQWCWVVGIDDRWMQGGIY